ncbi:DUF4168 domain-containing protein [Oceanibaculum nanhaiense]|uniref:DUF4168 domain-containing protein n=1 Tax=Oceanibaculum nanhaiense TaxID=1909734 RepID=UPI0015942F51|nr:DUF4168 domain-containing protein [Oceanibaculum nanhaiense]MBC7134552.1 DUF4168 domain-containing protein [Oceanibaculum nanhaiense]
MNKRILTTLLPALMLAVAPVAAMAQSQAPAQQQEMPKIDESQLDSYADAAVKIYDIRVRWEPEIRAAESQEKAMEAQREARTEMIEAVQKEGLSVEEYNSITAAAQRDPDLNQKIAQLIEKKR